MDREMMQDESRKARFLTFCRDNIHRSGLDKLLEWLESSDFYRAPASSKYHGAYPGGLLEHSLNVYDQLQRLRLAYPEIEVSDESAAIISLFHDLCKVNFYGVEKRNRKNEYGHWESYDSYIVSEKYHFGGHGSKSVFIVQNFMPLTAEEAAAINAHMGAFENDRVGDVYEQFPLAWLLHVADEAATYVVEGK